MCTVARPEVSLRDLKMLSQKFSPSTSTPFTATGYDVEDADSGYSSNLSGHCTSIDSCVPAGQSKSFISQTPDTVDSLFDTSSSEHRGKNSEDVPVRFRTKYFQTTLIGKENIDFLHYLGEKSNYTLIVKNILEYLKDADLYSAAAVSKTWKRIILAIPSQRKRFRNYAKKIELTKENRVVSPTASFYKLCFISATVSS